MFKERRPELAKRLVDGNRSSEELNFAIVDEKAPRQPPKNSVEALHACM